MSSVLLAMKAADWLVVSVMVHYALIGYLYFLEERQPLFLGLYWCYSAANVFLILIAIAQRKA